MRYMILIHSNPNTWEQLTSEQRKAFGREHMEFNAALMESGEHIASEGLAEPELGFKVVVRDGRTVTSDGPFAEAKEHLAGFYVIDVESHERAVELAARVPDARYGGVELRPVLDFTTIDL
jgi:hypothetical protein